MLVLASGAFVGLCAQEERVRPEKTDTELAAAEETGKAIEQALDRARATGLSGLRLNKAVLTLETGNVKQGGIKISFIIFTISSRVKKGETQKTVLTFGALAKPARTASVKSLDEPLADAILQAAHIAAQVKTLPLSEATVKFEFVVEKSVGGGVSFQVLGGSVGGDIDFSKVSKNSLEVTFSR